MSTAVTGIEREPFEKFDIALLGYNAELTKEGFGQFLRNNAEQISKADMKSLTALFKDGTRIKGLVSVNEMMRGYRFDQLILFDDDRWMIDYIKAAEIRWIQKLAMQQSNIPEEFQILKYEDIRD